MNKLSMRHILETVDALEEKRERLKSSTKRHIPDLLDEVKGVPPALPVVDSDSERTIKRIEETISYFDSLIDKIGVEIGVSEVVETIK